MKTERRCRSVNRPVVAAVLAFVVSIAGCGNPPDDQRQAAEWVLSTGGKVRVNCDGQQSLATSDSDLPAGPFVIESIAWDIYPGDENTQVNDGELLRLAKLTELRELDLWAARVTDKGVDALLPLQELRRLQLSQTQITDAGLERLQRLTKLTELGLVGTRVTMAGIRRFQRQVPKCKVINQAEP
jgi:hypothetical protein